MRFRNWLFAILLIAGPLSAAVVEIRDVPSAAMDTTLQALIILPDSYATSSETRFPVMYLLHGHGGDHTNWNAKTGVAVLADVYQMIIVCPDGNEDSWYFDSPFDPKSQFETHVAVEVVAFADANFRTINNRSGRAITGLSMGGHGALLLASRHPETFGAAGSISGGLDIRPFPERWGLAETIGSIEDFPARWDSLSVAGNIAALKSANLALIFDCGVNDFFIDVNRSLHRALLDAEVPHDYSERPGGHSWAYWDNSIRYQTLFFNIYFNKARQNDAPE